MLLNKPRGISSFKALYPVKRKYPGCRVGHAGTLDEEATGLLLVAVGQATKLLSYIEAEKKTYEFQIRFGVTTDTYDLAGEIISRWEGKLPTQLELEKILPGFVGAQMQTPPPYSAIKVGGVRASDRVRRGETVALVPRPIVIENLELLKFAPGEAHLRVYCSKGTYVRTLAHEMGQNLGCGAVVTSIHRSRIGDYKVEDAVNPDEVSQVTTLLPPLTAVKKFPQVIVSHKDRQKILNGNSVTVSAGAMQTSPLDRGNSTREVTLVEADGTLLALGEWEGGEFLRIQPTKVFGHDQ